MRSSLSKCYWIESLADHVIKTRHKFDIDKVEVLEVERNKKKCRIKENIHIIKNRKKIVKEKKTEIRHSNHLIVNLLEE